MTRYASKSFPVLENSTEESRVVVATKVIEMKYRVLNRAFINVDRTVGMNKFEKIETTDDTHMSANRLRSGYLEIDGYFDSLHYCQGLWIHATALVL